MSKVIETGVTAALAAVLFLCVGYAVAHGEPAPESPVCRFLASVADDAEIWRCSGAGFEASCYVSVSTGNMSKGASSIDCGGR
jgi:hypothetical protein